MKTDAEILEMWEAQDFPGLGEELGGLSVSIAQTLYTEKGIQKSELGLEDVVSTAFLSMMEALHSYNPERGSTLRGWVVYCTYYAIGMLFRKHTALKRGAGMKRVPLETAAQEHQEEPLRYTAQEDDMVDSIDLRRAFDNLSDTARTYLELDAMDFTLREMGERMGVSHETARKELAKARSVMEAVLSAA